MEKVFLAMLQGELDAESEGDQAALQHCRLFIDLLMIFSLAADV